MTANPANQADAELLSRIEAFWTAHKEILDSHEKWTAEKARVEALPECPPFALPAENREAYERHETFLKDQGVRALRGAFEKANKRQGKTVNAVFGIPARTYPGILAKLKIVEVAYGDGESGGDEGLEVWQDHDVPWLENAIRDFERLAARAPTTKHERPEGGNELDAELLRLNAEYRTLMGEINAGRHNDAEGNVSDEARNRMSGLEKKIADMPAESYAGIGIKLLIGVDNFCPLDPGETRTADLLNLESALADAERLALATSSTVAPETTGEDPFEALAAEWAEQKAECERLEKHEAEAGITEFGAPSDAAGDRLGEIEKRISETPTTTLLGIVTKLRVEAAAEVEYEFTTTENVIKTALAGVEHLMDAALAAVEQSSKAERALA